MAPEAETGAASLSVLHVCAPAQLGGLERVVQALALGLERRGHRVGVLAVVDPGADPSDFFEPLGGLTEAIALRVPGRSYGREITAVRRAVAAFDPDVLHTHGYRPDLLHGGWARRRGIATVSTLHGSSRMGGLSRVFEWIQELALRRFDAVVAVSRSLEATLLAKGVRATRVHLIPNAWEPPPGLMDRGPSRTRLGVDGEDVAVGWVGRLIPIKGCDVFLDALARLDRTPAAVVIGDGPERAALEVRAGALGLGGAVRFLGAVPDAARFFAALDLFVLSSRSEGTPMVLLEAMGAGVPVVATAVGGVPDVLRAPSEGWVVPPEDPEAMAVALDEALRSPEERARRSRSARNRVDCAFDRGAWVERHEYAYRAALGVRGRASGTRAGKSNHSNRTD